LGIASSNTSNPTVVTQIDYDVILLHRLYEAGPFRFIVELSLHTFKEVSLRYPSISVSVLIDVHKLTLNNFAALGQKVSLSIQATLQIAFTSDSIY
jgi:hypothetical protein